MKKKNGDSKPKQSQATHFGYLRSNYEFEFFVEYCLEYLGHLQCTSERKQMNEAVFTRNNCVKIN